MKLNLIGSTAHLDISSGNVAHYIKRLDIPALVFLKRKLNSILCASLRKKMQHAHQTFSNRLTSMHSQVNIQ